MTTNLMLWIKSFNIYENTAALEYGLDSIIS